MKTDDLADLIKERRSIRAWQDKKIPAELLTQAVELATYAPNAGNQQNWHFYIIVNQSVINSIADAVKESSNFIASAPEAMQMGDVYRGIIQRSDFFRSAPALIAVATSQYQSPVDRILESQEKTVPRAAEIRRWRNTASGRIQSAAAAIAYLLLILHQMGLGAVWMTGPMQSKGEIEKILKIPPQMDFIALIPVGYPAESPAARPRKPVKEVCEIRE